MWSDIRLAVRVLRRSPAFAFTAIAALALGIGANTAIFSVVNALLLNPPGIAQPDRVLAVRVFYTKLNLASISMSTRDIADVRDSRDVFQNTAGMTEMDFNYGASGTPERLHGALVTQEWFDVFGARPVLGRVFTPEEDQPQANQVVVLAHAAWQRLYGRDPNVIGRTIELNQKAYRIVGVMGQDFRWPRQVDVWAPLGLAAADYGEQNRFNESYTAVTRVRDGVPMAQAAAFVGVLSDRVKAREDRAGQYAKDSGWGMFAVPVTDFIAGQSKTPMLILMASVGFVLLIACANIAGLMLARSSSRIREIAIRAALGARRWDLLRQTLWESLLLAFAGALAGIALAWFAIGALTRLDERVATELVVQLDRRVLTFTAFVAILSGLLFWIAPAWYASSTQRYEVLKEGGRSAMAGRARQRLRATLVIGEVALALMLLIGAGLLLRSLARLQDVETGFDARGVMTATMSLPQAQYDNAEKRLAFYTAVLDNLAKAQGVAAASAGLALPFSGMGASGSFSIEGRPQNPGDPGPHGDVRYVSPDYFNALKIPLRGGRTFTAFDRRGTDPVVVIDENLARQYWPGEDVIGKKMRRGTRNPWATIVGVVGHVKHSDLAADTGKGVYYYPLLQQPTPLVTFAVRAAGEPESVVPAIREAVGAVDRTLPLHGIKSMDEAVQASLASRRFVVTLLLAFAGTALFLAGIGLYGLISYSVAQRTQEIGVRMALGAQRGDVLRLVVGQGLTLTIVGLVIGTIAAFSIGHLLSAQLFQVSAFDPMTAIVTMIVLLGTSLLASYVPARRASKVDPIVALRDE